MLNCGCISNIQYVQMHMQKSEHIEVKPVKLQEIYSIITPAFFANNISLLHLNSLRLPHTTNLQRITK